VRILLICRDNLFPPHFGSARRVLGISTTLAQLGHHVFVLYNGKRVRHFHSESVSFYSLPFRDPLSIVRFCDPLLTTLKIDIIQVEDLLENFELILSLTRRNHDIPVSVDMHNVNYVLAGRLGKKEKRVSEVRFVEWLTANLVEKYICVSETDKGHLTRIGVKEDKIGVVPNGVSARPLSLKKTARTLCKEKRYVVFLANFGWLPYYRSLKILSSKVVPKLAKDYCSRIRLLVLGRWPKHLSRINSPWLRYATNVADVFPYLLGSSVCLAPLTVGSGTKFKVLDYFLAGRPVVSTSLGVEGLDVVDRYHVLIEDDIENYGEKIQWLLENPSHASRIGINGRRLVLSRYTWQKVVPSLVSVYRDLLQGR
jgi:glycosyltransferase involved in cell wall biosynthesis